MTGTTLSSAGLDARRRRVLFRSWHRGMRENDLILGGFADACLPALTEAELDQYERLLEVTDTELLPWLTGESPAPPAHHAAIIQRIRAHTGADNR